MADDAVDPPARSLADSTSDDTLAALFRVGVEVGSSVGAVGGPRQLCDTIDLSALEPAPSAPPLAGADADDARPRAALAAAAAGGSDSEADEPARELTGPHTLSEDDDSDCPSEPEALAERTAELEARLRRARGAWALDEARTLALVFKLLDALVAQYQLNRMDELFAEFGPICARVRGKWHLKCIQSRAFCCFKQYRFTEALELFKEQERLMGPSAPLCENIGHVCSSLSEYDEAERYFRLATRLLPAGRQHAKNSGGVYLGLGLLLDRRERPREALPVLYQALELYKDSCHLGGRYAESSLVAKAHMSVANAHEHLGELSEAEGHFREAAAIFARTVGETSPLLAGALGALGKLRVRQGALADGGRQLVRALAIEVAKDAFHPRTVWELLEQLKVGREGSCVAHNPRIPIPPACRRAPCLSRPHPACPACPTFKTARRLPDGAREGAARAQGLPARRPRRRLLAARAARHARHRARRRARRRIEGSRHARGPP